MASWENVFDLDNFGQNRSKTLIFCDFAIRVATHIALLLREMGANTPLPQRIENHRIRGANVTIRMNQERCNTKKAAQYY